MAALPLRKTNVSNTSVGTSRSPAAPLTSTPTSGFSSKPADVALARKSEQLWKKTQAQQNRAKQKADQGPAVFFSGEEALIEVSKPNGVWNWALVGPDAEELPLSGGGVGSVEEMRESLDKNAHSFGLLRMTFGVGDAAKTRWVFIHAKDAIDSGNFSSRERGQAMMVEPKMDKAIQKLCNFILKVELNSKEDCTVEHFVQKIRPVVAGVEAGLFTTENFNAAVDQHKELHPQVKEQEEKHEKILKMVEEIEPPPPEVVEPEPEATPAEVMEPEPSRLRTSIRLYSKGDMVEVFSAKHSRWMLDAEIAEIVRDSCVIDGFNVRAGSMKVIYANGTRFKWVAPQQMEEHLRPSLRPRPPEPLVGMLLKETHNWITQLNKRYFEVHKGFLQWWVSERDARDGVKPNGSLYLLGLQLQQDKSNIKLRADSGQGVVYTFKAETDELAKEWSDRLWAHAGYCEEAREFYQAKQDNNQLRKELLNVMANRVTTKTVASERAAAA